jgi:ABC-type branched-subunit amino acid transport system permease subunit
MGPIIGAFVYYRVDQFTREVPDKSWLPEAFRDFLVGRPNLATLVFALLLIGLMFVAPFGIVGSA